MSCSQNCDQGRHCVCYAAAIHGPYKRAKPKMAPLWVRACRSADAFMLRCGEFWRVYRLYRSAHGRAYAARIAYGCAFRGLPF